jgi:aspartate-semialdehyde dehydrogenase
MKTGLTIGVAGATGVVGETALEILTDAEMIGGIRIDAIKAFASKGSAGKQIRAGQHSVTVETLESDSIYECDVVFFATDGELSKLHVPRLAERGILCIDNSSAFRMTAGIPLVVPEVNGKELENTEALLARPIIANPNCCAAPLTVALNPLKKAFGVRRVIVSTYQSVSGAGKQAVDLLLEETRAFLSTPDPRHLPAPSSFPKPIAFNVFPFVASIDTQGHTDEERKIIEETRKILGAGDLPIAATSVRVPTFVAHGESVTVELAKETSRSEILAILAEAPGLVTVTGEDSRDWSRDADSDTIKLFPTPREVHGKDPVYIGRVREVSAFTQGYGFSFWIVSDNLRKGAALNGVQILKHAHQVGLLDKLKEQRQRKR